MKPIKDKEIEAYLNKLTDFQKEIVLAIREIVLSADEKVKEGIKWGSIAFFNNKNICGFREAKAHISLVFMEGAMLSDKHKILQGSGTKVRTYKVTNVKDINATALTELVKEALLLEKTN